jgi:serine phosphatase RsbU (regulator of sigma subunit)
VPDSTNGRGQQYGYERLLKFLKDNENLSAVDLVERLARDVTHWSGSSPAFDDLTLLALEVSAEHGKIQKTS